MEGFKAFGQFGNFSQSDRKKSKNIKTPLKSIAILSCLLFDVPTCDKSPQGDLFHYCYAQVDSQSRAVWGCK